MFQHSVCYGQIINSATPLGFRLGKPFLPITPRLIFSVIAHGSITVSKEDYGVGGRHPFQDPTHRLQEGRILRTAVWCISKNNSQSLTHRNPLVLRSKLQHSSAQTRAWTTPEMDRVQPFSRSLAPESVLFVDLSPTISSWCRPPPAPALALFPLARSRSRSLCCQQSVPPGPLPGLPAGLHSTEPHFLSLL